MNIELKNIANFLVLNTIYMKKEWRKYVCKRTFNSWIILKWKRWVLRVLSGSRIWVCMFVSLNLVMAQERVSKRIEHHGYSIGIYLQDHRTVSSFAEPRGGEVSFRIYTHFVLLCLPVLWKVVESISRWFRHNKPQITKFSLQRASLSAHGWTQTPTYANL